MANIITTPRPPLNIFDVVRVTADDNANGTKIYESPIYRIPASGPTAQRDVRTAAILTNMIVSNLSAGVATASVWVIDKDEAQFFLAVEVPVAADGYVKIDLDKQVLKSEESIFVRMGAGQTAEIHLSFVLNQREEFVVIEP